MYNTYFISNGNTVTILFVSVVAVIIILCIIGINVGITLNKKFTGHRDTF